MKLQSLGKDTCMFDCYAMCMGIDVHDLETSCKAQGIPVVNPHPQELLPLCVALGYAPVQVSLTPRKDSAISHSNPQGFVFKDYSESVQMFKDLIRHVNACLLVGNHAVAWDCKSRKIFDPRGTKHDLNDIVHKVRGAILMYDRCS